MMIQYSVLVVELNLKMSRHLAKIFSTLGHPSRKRRDLDFAPDDIIQSKTVTFNSPITNVDNLWIGLLDIM